MVDDDDDFPEVASRSAVDMLPTYAQNLDFADVWL